MIALILTGHGRIASGMQEAIVQVFGEQAALCAIDFPEGNSTAVLDATLRQAIFSVDQGEGVVFVADLLGGSPFRIAATIAQERSDIEVVTGLNLQMFAEMLFERDEIHDVAEFRQRLVAAGKNGVTSLAERLARKREGAANAL
ncbi:PTS galactosamine/N-acetylgalactosamine transporter subunit IIA [Iodobacter fluviatilis]|uniref:PTS N-acetylgalactosamine transporter subunit IIA n=1 Tax=Iodobacter fluviatilis TaxID=537 RepID=A0A7G3G4Q9_9NEIS|nr:PTS galactosamine/N-acetylgalactosamine transporter subunit IIA [Iodobacter fluviatilis]QBC42241.1 PTS N-acetylgalactosamine transporter subunit IIA [Iodobacter fluviatilis]